jgi:hypothetical protein
VLAVVVGLGAMEAPEQQQMEAAPPPPGKQMEIPERLIQAVVVLPQHLIKMQTNIAAATAAPVL